MARRDGRAPRGERCRVAVPQGHYTTTTVTAALRTTGLCATALFDGPTNGARFRGCGAETLIPALRPGDTVILDNLQAHKVSGVREAIEAAGARLLYLPAYSPDFNPIEQAFRAGLRQAEEPAPDRSSTDDPGTCGLPSGKPSPASPHENAALTSLPPDTRTTWPSLHDREQL